MPYKTVWVEPEVFLEHNGVTVYHTYKDDDVDQGTDWYWFRLDQEEDDEGMFDIRDVDPLGLLKSHPPIKTGPAWDAASPEEKAAISDAWYKWYENGFDEARRAVLRHAIDKGLLNDWENGQ